MKYFLFLFYALFPLFVWAQVENPSVSPSATYYMRNEKGEEETDVITYDSKAEDTKLLDAPVRIVFQANPSIPDDYSSNVHYTWTITNTNTPDATPIIRNEEEFELMFYESGYYKVQLRAIFYGIGGVEDYEFPHEDEGEDPRLINFSIDTSMLEFPNGISPNGDGKNDELKPKDGFKGIVSFRATIFNRWGQRLYSWDDVHGSWDGKVNGKAVKDGVYFLNVSAKGSDGINYNIKKAINVISGYTNEENDNNGSTEE